MSGRFVDRPGVVARLRGRRTLLMGIVQGGLLALAMLWCGTGWDRNSPSSGVL